MRERGRCQAFLSLTCGRHGMIRHPFQVTPRQRHRADTPQMLRRWRHGHAEVGVSLFGEVPKGSGRTRMAWVVAAARVLHPRGGPRSPCPLANAPVAPRASELSMQDPYHRRVFSRLQNQLAETGHPRSAGQRRPHRVPWAGRSSDARRCGQIRAGLVHTMPRHEVHVSARPGCTQTCPAGADSSRRRPCGRILCRPRGPWSSRHHQVPAPRRQ
jgi:hypothetical protein